MCLVAGTRHSCNWSSPSSGEITKHTRLSYRSALWNAGITNPGARAHSGTRNGIHAAGKRDESMQAKSCKAIPSGESHNEPTHSGSVYSKRNASYCCNICCLSYFFSFIFFYIMSRHYFPLAVPTLRLSPQYLTIHRLHIFPHFINPPNSTSALTPTGLWIVIALQIDPLNPILYRGIPTILAFLLRSPYLSGSLYSS